MSQDAAPAGLQGMVTRNYVGTGITVHWDDSRCIHSERCITGAPTLHEVPVTTTPVVSTPSATTATIAVTPRPQPRSAPSRLTVPPFGEIRTIDSLREHLQCAIELEHATLPPYLCALYSLDRDRNRVAAEVIESVFVEEMLHLTLAANLLNAVGGRPRFDIPEMLPGFPRTLPHGDQSIELSLLPFGTEALEQFMLVERPAPADAPPEGDGYETIGQFYSAIRVALLELCAELGQATVFSGDPGRQIDGFAYGGSGRIIAVYDLESAVAAMDEIVHQGEGASDADVWDGDRDMFHPELEQVGHFYRMQELRLGRRFRRGDTPGTGPTGEQIALDLDGVQPMQRNPRLADHAPGSTVRIAQEAFNRTYCELLAALERAFDGTPDALGPAVGVMYQLKSQAIALMQMPTGDGVTTAGPTFEYVDRSNRNTEVTS